MKEFQKDKTNIEDIKMEKMIMVIVGIFIFCNSLQVLNKFVKTSAMELVADLLLTVNSSINAIVYGIFSEKYQKVLKNSIATSCGCGIQPEDTISIRRPNIIKPKEKSQPDLKNFGSSQSDVRNLGTSQFYQLGFIGQSQPDLRNLSTSNIDLKKLANSTC